MLYRRFGRVINSPLRRYTILENRIWNWESNRITVLLNSFYARFPRANCLTRFARLIVYSDIVNPPAITYTHFPVSNYLLSVDGSSFESVV